MSFLIDIGQKSMKVFTLVKSGNIPSFPECDQGQFDCGFVIPVFADNTGEELKNDKSSILFFGQSWTSAVSFTLQKLSSGVYSDQVTITDSTYGEYYALGDFTEQPYYSGIVIYWENVLPVYGVGQYRVKVIETNTLNPGGVTTYSKPYCLKTFGCGSSNNTVRLEWYIKSGIGDIDDDKKIIDYTGVLAPDGWYSQMRLPRSIFGYPKSEYETEKIQYANGQFSDVKNVQTETYQLTLGSLPAWVHNILKTYACQSDKLLITDYSNNNPSEIVQKDVKLSSSYEPKWIRTSKCAPVFLEFKPTYNRLERYRCL